MKYSGVNDTMYDTPTTLVSSIQFHSLHFLEAVSEDLRGALVWGIEMSTKSVGMGE
jgi:hypothetical protein